MSEPKSFHGIMVSSTFSDLVEHRRHVIEAIGKLRFHPNVMETSGAQGSSDVIDASLKMVQESSAFVGVISHRYGQTPDCSDRNPDALSICELEFNEAMRLNRPILLFIMADDHPITMADVEPDPHKKRKLDAFRERAKKMRKGSNVERIYEVFNSVQDFATKAATAVGRLSQDLTRDELTPDTPDGATLDEMAEARPPDLRAVPRYLKSHNFVGRRAELETLDDWCAAADVHPMLLFEAIGGTGKSMVTWTWLNTKATRQRDDWAGRFWFSFYESGATMAQFCRATLAYMTGVNPKALRKEKTRTLMPRLIAALEARPWLLVLDGLERILVAYHRIDSHQMRDEEADTATDQISSRDPLATINPEDEDLLRRLTEATPSKILVTSRLTPQALINKSGLPVPGVRREILTGLRPADAEALFTACGVAGDSQAIQDYLQRNCDGHPLVVGALAGLVNHYLPDRGNFDAWLADRETGGKLGLADMDLTQRKNHILDAAILDLPTPGRQLLQTMTLLQGGADYITLRAFNPHLPPPPDEVTIPLPPEQSSLWPRMSEDERKEATAEFEDAQRRHAAYLEERKTWERDPEVIAAVARFDATLRDLEVRGLLQYDAGLKTYDLHPVVRGVTSGQMGQDETRTVGERVVDHFSSRPHNPWADAETLEDLAVGIQLVTTFTDIGEFDRALAAYRGELHRVLLYNLWALPEIQRLLRPFFPEGWNCKVRASGFDDSSWLMNEAGNALFRSDPEVAQKLFEHNIALSLSKGNVKNTWMGLANLANVLRDIGMLITVHRLQELVLGLAEAAGDTDRSFRARLDLYRSERDRGALAKADALWARLDRIPRPNNRGLYLSGQAEERRATDLFRRGELTGMDLDHAARLCREGRNRNGEIRCWKIRGQWHLSRSEPELAIAPPTEALRLTRASGLEDGEIECLLALAMLQTGQGDNSHEIAERWDHASDHEGALAVAELWRALQAPEKAIAAAKRAHASACGDGEPFVFRYHLDRAEELLRDLGETPPEVPQHDPTKDEVFDFEDDVRALIEKTRIEREQAAQQGSDR